MSNVNKSATTLEQLEQKCIELEERLSQCETKLAARSNISERKMSDDDAKRVIGGDLKDATHKSAAEQLGLSYGQIYSARLGFTFKHIAKALREQNVKSNWL